MREAVNSSYGSYTTQGIVFKLTQECLFLSPLKKSLGTLSVGKSTVKCQQVEFYCLRKLDNPIRIPDDKEEVTLMTSGLDSKMIQVPLNHSSKDMKKLILS